MTTVEDIARHRASGSWLRLQAIALDLCRQTRLGGGRFFSPILGGGTRLMLALDHRISDDIDLFVDSPAWLPYLSPRLNDSFENQVSSYVEDGDHVKWRFDFGEIDFIVRTRLLDWAHLWNPPATESLFEMEPPLEVLAKKLFYRGWAMTPRDLFDWHAVENRGVISHADRQQISSLLGARIDEILAALGRIGTKHSSRAAWEAIRAPNVPPIGQVVNWAREMAGQYRGIASGKGVARGMRRIDH